MFQWLSSAMGFRAKSLSLVLVVVIYAPRCSDCSVGGRLLKTNEFPYTVYVKGFTHKACMGVVQDAMTIMTALPCYPYVPFNGTISGTVLTARDYFGSRRVYSTMWFDHTDPEAGNFTFVVVELMPPGITVDTFFPLVEGISTTKRPTTGIRVAEWLKDPRALRIISDNRFLGVVTAPDRKVVAMQLISEGDCLRRWRTFVPRKRYSADITSRAMCAIKAPKPVKDLKYGHVAPGYVCDDDAGSPFIWADRVVGLLVKAFCGSGTTPLAVFLTTTPFELDFVRSKEDLAH